MSRIRKRLLTALQPYRQHVEQVRRYGVLVLMGLGLLLLLEMAYDPSHSHRLKEQALEVERLNALNSNLAEKIVRSKAELNAMRNDENYLVHLARRDLGMVRAGEVIYEFKKENRR
jgi:cell division protein FtsB